MNELNRQNELLIEAFIEAESLDFTPNKDEAWKIQAKEKVLGIMEKHEEIRDLILCSYGNAGLMVRELRLGIDKYKVEYNPEMPNITIMLCPCGCIKDIREK